MQACGAKTVLVVEDDPSGRLMLVDYLRAKGYAPVAAGDGREGVARFAELRPALMLCDLHLPLLSGLEVVRAARTMPHGGQTPIVLMTAAYARRGDELAAAHHQISGYLYKPFSLQSLLERVGALIGPGASRSSG